MSDLLELCSDLPIRVVPAGEVLIEEGAPPGAMYVLRSGSVQMERDGTPFARIDHAGSVFGEMSVVLDRPTTATARATTEVTVHVVEDPVAFLTSRPGVALAVLRMTAARLDGLTQYLVDVKEQFRDVEGHVGMMDGILDALVHHQAPAAQPGSARDPEGY